MSASLSSPRHRASAKLLAILAFATISIIASAATSFSASTLRHTKLEKASPGPGDTIGYPPAALKLWFSEKADLKAVQLRLQMDKGPIATLGTAGRDSVGSDKSVVAPLMSEITPGTYIVTWSVAGADGHPVQGRYSFVLKSK
jgi:methionine-rich copper-binding protein CopC